MIHLPVIIDRPNDTFEWPKDSKPLYYDDIGKGYRMFPDSRFIEYASLETISFLKLRGFKVMEAPRSIVRYFEERFVMVPQLPYNPKTMLTSLI